MSLPHALAAVSALGPEWIQPTYILEKFGTAAFVAVLVIIFVECGLFVFFLPGRLAAVRDRPVHLHRADRRAALARVHPALARGMARQPLRLRHRAQGRPVAVPPPDSKLLNPEGIAKTHAFFEKYGTKAIVLGRFVPIVRTFITAMAGVGRMDARVYATWSLVGGVLWAAGLTVLGYFLGQNAFVQKNIELIAILIVVVSVIPAGVEWWRSRHEAKDTATS